MSCLSCDEFTRPLQQIEAPGREDESSIRRMQTTSLLVHGAWFGGWCYRHTANELRRRGHVVVTPTLTGVGERFHASSEAITLETHIRDMAGCIEAEEFVRPFRDDHETLMSKHVDAVFRMLTEVGRLDPDLAAEQDKTAVRTGLAAERLRNRPPLERFLCSPSSAQSAFTA
jgi:hypothetical protein